jgi:hypothetical protein
VKKLTLISLALSLLGAVNAVGAQTITQGGPTGTLVSVFTTASVATPIYTTPSKGHFVLTQVSGNCGPLLVQGFEPYPLAEFTFTPGLLIPPNTALSVRGTGDLCYITGVLEK